MGFVGFPLKNQQILLRGVKMEFQRFELKHENENGELFENKLVKIIRSHNFNNIFYKGNGTNITWGQKVTEDSLYSPFGPLIADIEISTICHGPKNKNGKDEPCSFCYKSNNSCGKNMTLEEFKVLFHKLPRTLTQIAFGIGDLQPLDAEMWKIFDYCRHNDYQEIVPNVTINGNFLTIEKAYRLKELMGAVAVSHYNDSCLDAVELLTSIGMKQINIHQLVSENTFDECMLLIEQIGADKRLSGLNAVVFLMLKPKGNRNDFKPITSEHYNTLIQACIDKNIPFGMDSCSACAFQSITGNKFKKYIEPCESFGLFSCYFNVDGKYFPCSFCEGIGNWKNGLDIKNDFLQDIWYNERVVADREKSLKAGRKCIMYDLTLK